MLGSLEMVGIGSDRYVHGQILNADYVQIAETAGTNPATS